MAIDSRQVTAPHLNKLELKTTERIPPSSFPALVRRRYADHVCIDGVVVHFVCFNPCIFSNIYQSLFYGGSEGSKRRAHSGCDDYGDEGGYGCYHDRAD